MIIFQNTRINTSFEKPVAVGSSVTAEGQALVVDNTGGVFGVKPSTGAAGERFAGVAFSQQLTLLSVPNIESRVQGATNIVGLAFVPLAGSLRILDVTSGTLQTVGTPATTANQYSIDAAGNVTLNAAQLGHTYKISYKYAPTVLMARAIQGDIPPGGAASLTLGSIGVITGGEVWTTEVDTTVDWTVANPDIKLGANGQFTIGGTGTSLTAAYITNVPDVGNPYLGIKFSV